MHFPNLDPSFIGYVYSVSLLVRAWVGLVGYILSLQERVCLCWGWGNHKTLRFQDLEQSHMPSPQLKSILCDLCFFS